MVKANSFTFYMSITELSFHLTFKNAMLALQQTIPMVLGLLDWHYDHYYYQRWNCHYKTAIFSDTRCNIVTLYNTCRVLIATTSKHFHARWCYVSKIAFDGIYKSLWFNMHLIAGMVWAVKRYWISKLHSIRCSWNTSDYGSCFNAALFFAALSHFYFFSTAFFFALFIFGVVLEMADFHK